MKAVIAALLILLASPPVGSVAAVEKGVSTPADPGLSPLAKKYALRREALLKEVAAKRRSMVESDEWRSQSADRRKAALDALISDAKSRDSKLTAEYDAEVRRRRRTEDADEEYARRKQLRQLDDIQVQAAQDALRATRTP